ncbi:MAG: decarboxylating 6-phosphogluconate dehydrogenase [Gemmatimonadales bacterium]|jgi:6-phosphogluconate dehydrogenase
MQIGIVGLGRMGASMLKRLVQDGHEPIGFDLDEDAVRRAGEAGGGTAESLEQLVERLDAPRAVWVMLPHGDPTAATVRSLIELLEPDDIVVNGGNSRWTASMALADECREAGIHFVDAGVSGGVWGLEEGYCLMVGGPDEAVEQLEPVFTSLAPEGGYGHVGPTGAGHFVKMVHNGVEYAMLQALGEGFEALHSSEFDLDLEQIASLWQHGSVVRSWLLSLLEDAFAGEGADLEQIGDYVDDSGMGRWTVEYAVDQAIPLPAITTALYERFASRQEASFSAKVIAALRNEFGGHEVEEVDQ